MPCRTTAPRALTQVRAAGDRGLRPRPLGHQGPPGAGPEPPPAEADAGAAPAPAGSGLCPGRGGGRVPGVCPARGREQKGGGCAACTGEPGTRGEAGAADGVGTWPRGWGAGQQRPRDLLQMPPRAAPARRPGTEEGPEVRGGQGRAQGRGAGRREGPKASPEAPAACGAWRTERARGRWPRVSNTLGTARGRWTSRDCGLGGQLLPDPLSQGL